MIRCAAPGVYTIADDTHGLPYCVSNVLGHNGLDQFVSMFAPYLLGCPVRAGITRYPQRGTDAGDRTERQVPVRASIV
jgi:hypothetical protein